VTECTNVEYFYNDGTKNVCIETDINSSITGFGCQNLGIGKYSLLKIQTVSGNTKTMKECISSCPAGEVFIPQLTELTVYDQNDRLKCKLNCPTASGTVSGTSDPYLRIKTKITDTISGANDFYSVSREYCTPNCITLGGSTFENIFTNQNG
jgi:hypothetical protein